MMKSNIVKQSLLGLLFLTAGLEIAKAQSAIYACGHIRRTRETAIDNLRSSGYTTAIIFNVTVEKDGTLTTDYNWDKQEAAEAGGIICKDGEYVFDEWQPHYVDDIYKLLEPPTSINRLEFCIGGWSNQSYINIKNLIEQYGTGPETVLYKNFKAFKEKLPIIVAVNNDDEHGYDVASTVAFHKMMAEIGFRTTVAPYTNPSFWKEVVSQLNETPGTCEIIYMQAYGGGAANMPATWNIFGGVPMYVGFDCEANSNLNQMVQKFTNWSTYDGVTGGFLWNYNSESRNVNQWASAINRIFNKTEINKDEAAATFYSELDYKGYAASLSTGEYYQSDLALRGIAAKTIASISINKGYKVTIYTNKDLTGQPREITEPVYSLGTEWNNKTCSLKIEEYVEAAVDDVDMAINKHIKVYSLEGRLLIEEPNAIEKTIETSISEKFPAGIYIIDTPGKTYKFMNK